MSAENIFGRQSSSIQSENAISCLLQFFRKRPAGRIFFLFCAMSITSGVARSQEPRSEPLKAILDLQQHGHFSDAISAIKSADESGLLAGSLRGQFLTTLGFDYESLGRLDLARTAFEQAIESFRRAGGISHDYAVALMSLANLDQDEGFVDQALKLDGESLEVCQKIKSSSCIAHAYAAIASRELVKHRLRRASAHLAQSRELLAALSDAPPQDLVAEIDTLQARLEDRRGDHDAAIAEARLALIDWQACMGTRSLASGLAQLELGVIESSAGDQWSAVRDVKYGMQIIEESVGPGSQHYLRAEMQYAKVLRRLGCHLESESIRRSVLREYQSMSGRECMNCRITAVEGRF